MIKVKWEDSLNFSDVKEALPDITKESDVYRDTAISKFTIIEGEKKVAEIFFDGFSCEYVYGDEYDSQLSYDLAQAIQRFRFRYNDFRDMVESSYQELSDALQSIAQDWHNAKALEEFYFVFPSSKKINDVKDSYIRVVSNDRESAIECLHRTKHGNDFSMGTPLTDKEFSEQYKKEELRNEGIYTDSGVNYAVTKTHENGQVEETFMGDIYDLAYRIFVDEAEDTAEFSRVELESGGERTAQDYLEEYSDYVIEEIINVDKVVPTAKEIEAEINKTLEGTGITASIWEREDDIVWDEDEDENEDISMYEGVLVGKDDVSLDDTLTGCYGDIIDVANELRNNSIYYTMIQMAMKLESKDGKIGYVATGIVEDDKFTGEVCNYSKDGENTIDYIFKGKYLPELDRNNNPIDEAVRERFFDLLVGDRNFLTACWEINNMHMSPNRAKGESEYFADKPKEHSTINYTFLRGEEFTPPTHGNTLAHDNATMLDYETVKSISEHLGTYSTNAGIKDLYDSGIEVFVEDFIINDIVDRIKGDVINPFEGYTEDERKILVQTLKDKADNDGVSVDGCLGYTIKAIERGEDIRIKQTPYIADAFGTRGARETENRATLTDPIAIEQIDSTLNVLGRANDDVMKCLTEKDKLKPQKEDTPQPRRA